MSALSLEHKINVFSSSDIMGKNVLAMKYREFVMMLKNGVWRWRRLDYGEHPPPITVTPAKAGAQSNKFALAAYKLDHRLRGGDTTQVNDYKLCLYLFSKASRMTDKFFLSPVAYAYIMPMNPNLKLP